MIVLGYGLLFIGNVFLTVCGENVRAWQWCVAIACFVAGLAIIVTDS